MNKIIKDLTMIATPEGRHVLRGKEMQQLKIYKDCSLVIEEGKIAFIGIWQQVKEYLEKKEASFASYQILSGKGKCALPGFVDSHTHFVFGGYRPEEFLMRLNGEDYLEIHRKGGGIESTVQATRGASFEELYHKGMVRLDHMLAQGVTCVEGKSGYGLDLDTEIRQLKVMQKCNENHPVEVVNTFLGAHAVAKEFAGRGDDYITYLIDEVLPEVAEEHLAQFCDAFVEKAVFDAAQGERLFAAAEKLGFQIKIHADEMNSVGGVPLGIRYHAVSADHLLMITDDDIRSLSKSDTVATLLPSTAFCLNKPYAPARKMIDAGCGIALASDFNPGSCFSDCIPLMIALAVIQMGMSLEETITALTLNGAAALQRADRLGSIEPGKDADIVLLGCPDYKYLVYYTMENLVDTVIKKGIVVKENHYEM